MPGLYGVVAMILVYLAIYGLYHTLESAEMNTEPFQLYTKPEYILWIQVLTWGVVVYLVYLIASILTVYWALSRIREHIYNSALVTYYHTRGVDYVGSLYYLKDMLNRSTLPSPVTGLLLTFLTGGLIYPIILCFMERAVRVHALMEEEAFFKRATTRSYSGYAAATDIALAILTLGAYTAFMGYRLASTFNKHVKTIHSKHPEPPSTPTPVSSEPGAWITPSSVIAIILLFSAVCTILVYITHVGLLYFPQIAYGLLLSALVSKRSGKNVLRNIAVAYLILVILIICGYFVGYVGWEAYREFYSDIESFRELISYLGIKGLVLFIFTNNSVISISSPIPYIGGIFIGMGAYNAGFQLGVYSALNGIHPVNALSILVYPHAIPELLGYSALISASTRFGNWGKFATLIITGLVILFIAAVIETSIIIKGSVTLEDIVDIIRELAKK